MGRKKEKKKVRRGRRRSHKLKPGTIYTIFGVVLLALGGLTITSFVQDGAPLLGELRALLVDYLGILAFVVPIVLWSMALAFFRFKASFASPAVPLGLSLIFFSLAGMGQSGRLGMELWTNVAFFISAPGAWFLFAGCLVIGLSILLNTSLDEIVYFFMDMMRRIASILKGAAWSGNTGSKPATNFNTKELAVKENMAPMSAAAAQTKTMAPAPVPHKVTGLSTSSVMNAPGEQAAWEYPPISLLADTPNGKADAGDVRKNAAVIEQTLDSFGIKARVSEVNVGPAVAQYALEIALGTKVAKITSLSSDLALALAAPTGQIRIEAPIPGRSLVGVEVPNRALRVVTLKEMLLSTEMSQSKSKLAVTLGLDVSGKPLIADIASMPHVLVAGTTGSGKSVMINSLITNLLFRTTPQEVRLILVDPKRVELTLYNDIPHLLTPVIVEVDQTLSALKWAVDEMDRRYKMFSEIGARNIASYNEIKGYQELPYIVIFIDELADLMMFAPAEVEDKITRLAQMARATGIHLVLSTQRPSVNVITGLIKANIPTRIAFNVSSMVDSRVILDTPGAEKLLGRGDMLFIPPEQAKPNRIQGTFVSEKEVKKLVEFLKQKAKARGIPIEYTEEVIQQKVAITRPSGLVETADGQDPLFEEARAVVMQYDRASASLLQRRLKLGYARAARVLDQLEAAGIVGPSEGSKPREVLMRSQPAPGAPA
jgi:DNA segregation ATPase FtsK/SpoIIIE, S-DNA-T family